MYLVERGIAYHHGGMLPVLREFVELCSQHSPRATSPPPPHHLPTTSPLPTRPTAHSPGAPSSASSYLCG